MPALPRPSSEGTAWIARVTLLVGLSVLGAVCVSALRPIREAFPPHEIEFDLAGAQHDAGSAYRVTLNLGPEVSSDKDGGLSLLQLYEDDTALVAHGVHQQMRDGERGRFSHWGETLYFTTTDASDPRDNGRHYHASLPTVVPAWSSEALRLGSGLGIALSLFGLILPAIRKRRFAAALPALLIVAVGALLLVRTTWWSAVQIIEQAFMQASGASVPAAGTAHGADRPGNVTRLLPGSRSLTFLPSGELPAQDGARVLPLVPQDNVATDGEFFRLEPGAPGLVATLEQPVAVRQIASILVPAQIGSGGDLELRLLEADEPDRSRVRVALPAAARDGLQPLVIRRPFEFFLDGEGIRIARIELAVPFSAEHAVLLSADAVVLSGPSTRFLQATDGEDALSQGDQLRPTHWQSVPGRFRVPLDGDGTLVKGAVGLFGSDPASPVRFSVSHVDANGVEQLLFDDELTRMGMWHELRVDLERLSAARDDSLVFDVDALPPGTALGWAGWRLVDTSRSPRRVLVTLLDTLRLDAVSAYGGNASHTPVLDALAAEGVRFDRCIAQAHWTRPSMPSIMTGRYVAATGIDNVGQQLPSTYATLAEAFADAGFLTIGDVANVNAGPAAGLGQGWDQLHLSREPALGLSHDQLSGDLAERLVHATEEDLLLYVHLMDAHGPYGPPLAPADQGPTGGEALSRLEKFDRAWVDQPTAAGRRHWYYRDVETMDAALGVFIGKLETLWGPGSREQLTYAVLVDHGEYLGEHGQWGHGWHRLLPEVVHVPLVLGGPALQAGTVVTNPVENIDVAPTLLELLGIPANALPDTDGRSLLRLLHDDDASMHGVAIASVRLGQNEQLSVYDAAGALLGDQRQLVGQLSFDPQGAATTLPTSAGDDENLLERELRIDLATRFEDFWRAHTEAGEARRALLWEQADGEQLAVDPAALRQLKALGYLDR
jgi:hypothetical protein